MEHSGNGPVGGEADAALHSADGWRRLWWVLHATGRNPCPDGGALGEYAAVLHGSGVAAAEQRYPQVAAHLELGCATCEEDLQPLLDFLAQEE
jgi:hypothetical protein